MSWATEHINELKQKRTIDFPFRGNSMDPHIKDGQRVTFVPVAQESKIELGDILLCVVYGTPVVARVSMMKDGLFQMTIKATKNLGWTSKDSVYGKCVFIDD